MPHYVTKRSLRHSADQMFDLVADIERYPEFVPMCERLVVRRRTTGVNGSEVVLADMAIGYKLIRESFTSRVALDRENRKILVEYVDGPFSHLENRWSFVETSTGCDVVFDIDYAFRSRTFQMLVGVVFDTVVRKMVEAFETRADKVYG
ncbi:MAG: type II toxin-antitoxin system RatA family toxin [Beijerinckiaceae bacterium]